MNINEFIYGYTLRMRRIQPVNQYMHQSIKSIHRSINQSTNQSINQPTNQSIDQSTNQSSSNQSINLAANQSIKQAIDRSTSQPTDRPTDQSTNVSTNQHTSQHMEADLDQAAAKCATPPPPRKTQRDALSPAKDAPAGRAPRTIPSQNGRRDGARAPPSLTKGCQFTPSVGAVSRFVECQMANTLLPWLGRSPHRWPGLPPPV